MKSAGDWLTEKVLIPDLLGKLPQARPVLDRYGLRGCGGPLGPVETLGFFARAHDVPIGQLLEEIRAAREPSPKTLLEGGGGVADAIYRPFFKAGIVVVLTLGAAWGAYLLWRIGWSESFAAAGIHEVNAHGHAQIFGWVGLFVMGFAYQAFPRFKHASLACPRLAFASLWLMLAGLVIRSVCEPLAEMVPGMWPAAVAASVLEVAAIVIFAGVIAATWRQSGKSLAFYDFYVISSLIWFVVQAIYEAVYLTALFMASGREEVLALVSTWQGPLREIQIHGFALLMILGVSQRIFHHFYGLPAPHPAISRRVLAALNLAIVGEVAGFILMRRLGPGWAMLWYGAVLTLAGALVILIQDWHIFSRPRETDRSLKFLRAAYIWLFVSLGMLVLLPVYQQVLPWLSPASPGGRFSHAYYGAIRHAITVGFISLMIVGVAAKVVPTLNGVDGRALSRLWFPFVLINGGCLLRVSSQTLTDLFSGAFSWASWSGLMEVTGLALWGVHLWGIMAGRARFRRSVAPPLPLLPGGAIEVGHRVADVLKIYPNLLEVFVGFGFKPLANPFFRRTIAARITIDGACRFLGVDGQKLLEALNKGRPAAAGKKISLPMIPDYDSKTSGGNSGPCRENANS